MKPIFWFLALALVAPKLLAEDTGLYDISNLLHPAPLTDQIKSVDLVSQSNDNKRYYIAFKPSNFFSLPCSRIALIVGDKTILFHSQGMDNAGHYTSMETQIDDPEIIPLIEKHFHTTAVKRRHPGNRMLVAFTPDKVSFAPGEPVTVTLHITNVGDTEFAYMQGGRQRGSRDNQFAFTAETRQKMLPDVGNPLNFGGLGVSVRLKPGQSQEIRVDLNKWFAFNETGTYNVRGSYYMDFIDPKEHGFTTLWEDFACAEFKVELNRQ